MKLRVFLVALVLVICFLTGCQKHTAYKIQEERKDEAFEKGYDLPIEDNVREEIESDLKEMLGRVRKIYIAAYKGNASNVVISDETAFKMLEVIREEGYPTTISALLSDMSNYGQMEDFFK